MELPRLEPLHQTYRDRGLRIVAVDGLRDRERATEFIADKELTYTFLENGAGEDEFVYDLFQVSIYPTTFLIAADGRVLYRHVGLEEGDEARLAREIDRILEM